MHKTADEAVDTVNALKALLAETAGVDIVVCPTFTALHAAGRAAAGSRVQVGAQNCFTRESGAYTGEISPQMILDAGCTWAIVGHSERRQIFGEADALLNEKLRYALACGLKVMFCIGETLEEREGGSMNEVLGTQLTEGLKGLEEGQFVNVAVAYEPIWAIGTGVVATPAQAEEAHAYVRGVVAGLFGETIAAGLRIQYGGSVKPGNAAELIANPNVDGFLVGGAALDAESFAEIVKAGTGA